ncbi:MAG: hypothetical protein ACJ8GW_01145 [Massilia sp.]
MDQSKVLYFQETYAKMSDDELAYLIATRIDGLVEEARVALNSVLQARDLKNIEIEVASTVKDLKSQAAFASQEAQKQQRLHVASRKAFHWFSALLSIFGLALLIFGDDEHGPIFVAAGLVSSALFELRRLAAKFIATLFKMN